MEDLRADLHSVSRRDTALLRSAAGKPRRPRLDRHMRADEAFRVVLSDCLSQATAQAGILRASRSAVALHQLRVALRRLEVMLAAFGEAFGQAWFGELRGRAKAISARLSGARDLDVFLDDLWPDVLGREKNYPALRRAAETRRDAAWTAVAECVASQDFSHLLDDVAALSQSRLPMGGAARLKKVARRLLDRAARRVEKRGRRAASRAEGDLHRLRIGLKKLRYLSQAFAPLYPDSRTRPYLKRLRRLQEQLGRLNDTAHARATLADLLRGGDAALGYGAGLFAGRLDGGRTRRAAKALARYKDFRGFRQFWAKRRD